MLKRLIHRLLLHRHPWRDIGFDELSELYTGMMFRSLAISLVGIFVPVYLVQLGYGLVAILSFFGFFFTARIVWDIIAGYIIARIGPKHSFIISYLLQILALLLLITLKELQWPLALIAVLWGGANSVFFVAFHVDFSKIKHREHGGKELGFMTIIERIGRTLGPVLGGLVAAAFDARYTFVMAVGLFMAGLVPLFLTGEPVQTHQRLDFRGLQIGKLHRDLFSFTAVEIENTISLVLWPLFMTLFIFQHNPYAKIGLVTSIAMATSIIAARAVGKLVDNYQGRSLLRYGAAANAGLHLSRPFAGGFGSVLGINVINEAVTVAYRIPYTKGMYDAADELPGHRIVYIVSMEALASVIKATLYWTLCILAMGLSGRLVLAGSFVIAAIASCLIMTERYAALGSQKGGRT